MGSLDGTGFLSNEACTSPGSHWSESSSGKCPQWLDGLSPDACATCQSLDVSNNTSIRGFLVILTENKVRPYWPDRPWRQTSLPLLCNKTTTSPFVSAVDELEETPQYLTLGTDMAPATDNIWRSFQQSWGVFSRRDRSALFDTQGLLKKKRAHPVLPIVPADWGRVVERSAPWSGRRPDPRSEVSAAAEGLSLRTSDVFGWFKAFLILGLSS